MATNDGQKLLVFGLSFAQHDSRKMQQVLRHYKRMPSTPGSRAALFVELTKLGKELAVDKEHQIEAQKLGDWFRHGGDFPLGITPAPINATPTRDHDLTHTPIEAPGVVRRLGQYTRAINNRYGPGHTLNDPEDGEDNSQHASNNEILGNPPIETQHGWQAPERGDSERGTADSDSDEDMDRPSDDDHEDQEWNAPGPTRAVLYGPGRTLNDAGESPVVVDQDEIAPPAIAPPADANNVAGIPQLRGDQQWRGNNVHGIQPHGGGVGMGMGMIPNRMPRVRQRRPRMEHDLEEEDDEMNDWNVGHGHFALGPGRTLNDSTPEEADDLQENPTDDLQFVDDENHHSNTDIEDAASAGNPEDDDAEPIECPICLEEYPPSGFPKRATITELCDHPDKSCLQCLDSSITTIIQTGALHILACPICPQKLTTRDVKEYANKKVYERYKYLKQQALRPGHYISCTNASCGGSQAHDSDGPTGPRMVCNFCQAETCARHRRPWHEGQTCLEFDMDPAQIERLEEEEATAKLLAKEATSICPKCGQGVTKTEGCDHMMCQCGTEWCYVVRNLYNADEHTSANYFKCSCSWENILRIGATAHATFCIYHPNKVNLTKTQQEAARARIMGLVHGGEVSAELSRARDEFRQRRREEMRPKLAEAAEARRNQMLEQKRQQSLSSTGETPPRKKNKVKLLPPWQEGGRSKRAL